jgi:hypothetical protein
LEAVVEMTDQIYTFFICLLGGVASGVVYEVIYIVKLFVKGKKMAIALDILFFLVFAAIYVFLAVIFSLPYFRLYMFIACQVGLLLYLKSIHYILAFFIEMVYNRVANK